MISQDRALYYSASRGKNDGDDYRHHMQRILECLICYTFLVDCWTAEENTHVLKGEPRSANSVKDCLSECIKNASCDGVDWNPNPRHRIRKKCWLSGPWSKGKAGHAGITHYTFNRKCPGKNLWLARSFHVSFAKRTFQFNSTFVN